MHSLRHRDVSRVVLLLGILSIGSEAPAADKLFDWDTNSISKPTAVQTGGAYSPIGWIETLNWQQCMASNSQLGLFTGLQTRSQTLDRFGQAFEWMSANGYRFDYLFMDHELTAPETPLLHQQLGEIIDRIRNDPDSNINRARIGNYGYHPGMYTETYWHQWPVPPVPEFAEREAFYYSSGMDMANPNLYPYAFFINHTTACVTNGGVRQCFVGGASPNQRSALFWAPLEKLSNTKRKLPDGDELIPYVNDFNPWPGYNPDPAQLPTPADNAASIQHYRLRGADGYYAFISTMDYLTYRNMIAGAWHELDAHFNQPGSPRILNLATNKSVGLEWSAVQKGNRLRLLVSNLHTIAQRPNWMEHLELPALAPWVETGQHMSFQYQSAYFEYDDMSRYTPDRPMNDQGAFSWQGPGAEHFVAAVPSQPGNDSGQAIFSASELMNSAWYPAAQPRFDSQDRVAYSAWLFTNGGLIAFAPVDTQGLERQGPLFSVEGTRLTVRIGDALYEAVNEAAALDSWHEAQISVDPADDTASAWIRHVTQGQVDFVRLVFDDLATSETVERLSSLPYRRSHDFSGWRVTAAGAGNAIDNLNVGYAVPWNSENFDHAIEGGALTALGWQGPDATHWQTRAPSPVNGNESQLAASPQTGAGEMIAWRRIADSGFDAKDAAVYSALLHGNDIGFSPVNTRGADPVAEIAVTGPHFSMRTGADAAFRFMPAHAAGVTYRATVEPLAGHWYEAQMVIDPSRGAQGAAKIYIRDITMGGSYRLLEFNDVSTGDPAELTELPLLLDDTNNPATWDGWQIRGVRDDSQIDRLEAHLYPYVDAARGEWISARMLPPSP
jgi:hypothetical protein